MMRIAAGALAIALSWAWVSSHVPPAVSSAQGAARPDGWSDATHGNRARPDYGRLFSMDTVHELHITIEADRFRAMQEDLTTISPLGMRFGGPPGRGGRPGGPAGAVGGVPGVSIEAFIEASTAACREKAAAAACTVNGIAGTCNTAGDAVMCLPAPPVGMAQGAAPVLTTRDPIYVPVTVRHDGRVWTHVGMRYKGNSSLMSATVSGNGKVPFRLDFDRYEDEFPAIRNQRFYGFAELTFSSGFSDDSQIREVLATEILRDRGIPAARAAFYRMYVDTGSGPEYWGLYTMVEDPSDGAMLEAQFGSGNGNLYKPEGIGANWTAFNEEGFDRKSNEDTNDFRDVKAAVAALHAPREDPAAWRAGLEAHLDVDHFLRWLAVNTAIENWDSYGAMAHNYYLYGDPAAGGRLKWIPWDHNMAFGAGPNFAGGRGRGGAPFPPRGGPPPGAAPGGFRGAPPGGFPGGGPLPFGPGAMTDVLHRRAGDTWPLISRLMADEVYAARYRAHLEHALGGLFAPDAIEKRARELHTLITPAIVGERGERPTHTTVTSPESFQRALDGPDGLIARITRRQAAIRSALNEAQTQ
jgi:hypothetical protein